MQPQETSHWISRRNLLAGVVLCLAILDHTRLFFHYWNTPPADLQHPDLALFFTRFSAHFFAPAAFLLTGITLYQQGLKRSKRQNTWIWARNGIGLILLEVVVNNWLYTFDPYYRTIGLFIIGMMGICFLLLAIMQYVPVKILIAFTLMILIGHNLLDGIQEKDHALTSILWYILHQQKFIMTEARLFTVNYTVLPWFALLLGGYLSAPFMLRPVSTRQRRILGETGFVLCLLFFVLRFINVYGDPQPWQHQATLSGTLLSFFNVTKYPASLDYLCITVGVLMLLYVYLGKKENKVTRFFAAFGKMPLTVYLLSTLLIHFSAMIGLQVKGRAWSAMIITPASYEPGSALAGYGFPLAVVYVLWLIFLLLLYGLLLILSRLMKRSYRMPHTVTGQTETISHSPDLLKIDSPGT